MKFSPRMPFNDMEESGADGVVYGIRFISNPDLPERFRRDAPLDEPDQTTFYRPGERGYTDYPSLGLKTHAPA